MGKENLPSCGETHLCGRGKGTAVWLVYLRLLTQFGFRSLQSCQKDICSQFLPHKGPYPPRTQEQLVGQEGRLEQWWPGWDNSPAGSTSRLILCTVWGPEIPSTTQPYTDVQKPSSLPTLPPSSCVSTATQGRLATRTEDLSPCPPPGALHSLSAAQWPPPSCGDGHGPVGLQGARASPSRSSSWSRSTCAPGCHRRHRSCVYLQPPPREELSVRSGGGGEGQGQSPPATSLGPTWLYRMGLML